MILDAHEDLDSASTSGHSKPTGDSVKAAAKRDNYYKDLPASHFDINAYVIQQLELAARQQEQQDWAGKQEEVQALFDAEPPIDVAKAEKRRKPRRRRSLGGGGTLLSHDRTSHRSSSPSLGIAATTRSVDDQLDAAARESTRKEGSRSDKAAKQHRRLSNGVHHKSRSASRSRHSNHRSRSSQSPHGHRSSSRCRRSMSVEEAESKKKGERNRSGSTVEVDFQLDSSEVPAPPPRPRRSRSTITPRHSSIEDAVSDKNYFQPTSKYLPQVDTLLDEGKVSKQTDSSKRRGLAKTFSMRMMGMARRKANDGANDADDANSGLMQRKDSLRNVTDSRVDNSTLDLTNTTSIVRRALSMSHCRASSVPRRRVTMDMIDSKEFRTESMFSATEEAMKVEQLSSQFGDFGTISCLQLTFSGEAVLARIAVSDFSQ